MGAVRLFISYSSYYQQDVDDIIQFLQERGAEIWADHMKLVPGEPNWQRAIDMGIQQATHIIYCASKRANESSYVNAELQLATIYHKPIIPFWLDGEHWVQCAPMAMSLAQFIDGRGTKRAAAKERLAQLLYLPAKPDQRSRAGDTGMASESAPPTLQSSGSQSMIQSPSQDVRSQATPATDDQSRMRNTEAPQTDIPAQATVLPSRDKRQGEGQARSLLTRRLLLGGTATSAIGLIWWIATHHDAAFNANPQSSGTRTSTPHPTATTNSLLTLGFQEKTFGSIKVLIPPLITIPAGPFMMGSDQNKDTLASDYEMPYQTVTLGAYQIGKYPLTVAEYAYAVGQTVNGVRIREPGIPYDSFTWQEQQQQPDHPVVNISWQDTLRYVQWLAQVTGQPWRMPTEAEWEKGARGTDGRIYPYGNTFDPKRGNTSEAEKGTTTPVGSYPTGASFYGAQDMCGNVLQWCSSEFKKYPYNAQDGRESLDSTNEKVLRGCSFIGNGVYNRAAWRTGRTADTLEYDIGARLVL